MTLQGRRNTSLLLAIALAFACATPSTRERVDQPAVAAREDRQSKTALAAPPPPPPPPALAEAVLTAASPMASTAQANAAGAVGGAVGGVTVDVAAKRARMTFTDRLAARDEAFDTEEYGRISENPFLRVADHPLSTFSIDVDRASYSNVRRYLMEQQQLPPRDAVRIEEMINYFNYAYAEPRGRDPFAIHTELADCPWQPRHRLLRIGLQARRLEAENLPPSSLTFLIDVSGSMMPPDRLPLIKSALPLLVDQLRPQDRVSIVVYAGAAGLVLPSTPGSSRGAILDAITRLEAGGSTAGGAGIRLAYDVARQNFIRGGNNRVILATDGDFNVGTTSDGELEALIEEKRRGGVFLSVLGFGRGNLKDSKMELLADKGNGNYAYIDSLGEARKVFVSEFGGTIFTVAKDVKLQLEFNPARVAGYRLLGYENRLLHSQDFNDDAKDAGEIGSGHSVTALYEIVPAGMEVPAGNVDALKYQTPARPAGESADLLTVKVRYKDPDGERSRLVEVPVLDASRRLDQASDDFRFAAAVAEVGMLLRGSAHHGDASFDAAERLAASARGRDPEGHRAEFLRLVDAARRLTPSAQVSRITR